MRNGDAIIHHWCKHIKIELEFFLLLPKVEYNTAF